VRGMEEFGRRRIHTIGEPIHALGRSGAHPSRHQVRRALDLGIDPEVIDAMVSAARAGGRRRASDIFEERLRLMRGGADEHRSMWLIWETGRRWTFADGDGRVPRRTDEATARRHGARLWKKTDAIDAQTRELATPRSMTSLPLDGALHEPLEEACYGERAGLGSDDGLRDPIVGAASPCLGDRRRAPANHRRAQDALARNNRAFRRVRRCFGPALEVLELDWSSRAWQRPAPSRRCVKSCQ